MADGFALALQKGLRATLVADSTLAGIVSTRIYDEPPQDAVFPYLRFGEISPNAFDTDTIEGALVDVTFEAHSRSPSGRVEAVQIVEAVKSALHRQESAVSVAGFNLVELIFETFSVTRDSEGRGYTAVIVLQAMLEDTA
jgi:hypothetical protein